MAMGLHDENIESDRAHNAAQHNPPIPLPITITCCLVVIDDPLGALAWS